VESDKKNYSTKQNATTENLETREGNIPLCLPKLDDYSMDVATTTWVSQSNAYTSSQMVV
jgi:hypothetical protein